MSQGVDCLICLPKTAWPPTLKIIFSKLETYNENNPEFDEDVTLEKERWKEYIPGLKASAFLNGRSKVNLSDIF